MADWSAMPGGYQQSGYGADWGRVRRRRRPGRVVLSVLIILVLALVGVGVYLDSSIKRVTAMTNYPNRPAASAGTNWLLVGSDTRQGLTDAQLQQMAANVTTMGHALTDSMMLLHIPSSGRPTLVSLPRDSYVSIPGYGKNKLNAAYAFGGQQLLTRTVEQATGLQINHYAEIGFGGFVGVVNAVGGVNMCISQPMQDPAAGLNLNAGCQTLNGAQALGYVRSRHLYAMQDLTRIQQQRQFLSALLSKATSWNVLANPFALFPLITDSVSMVTIDNSAHLPDLISVAFALSGSGSSGPVSTMVPVSSTPTVPGVGSVVMWDSAQAQQLFDALRQDQPVPSSLIPTTPLT